MRLKTLRKNRPPLEIEGAILHGNRMDLSNNVLKSTNHRSNTSFAFPTSLNTKISYSHISPFDQTHEMSTYSFHGADTLSASPTSNMSSYAAIQAAYLEHGIRLRLSSKRTVSATRPQSGRKSAISPRPRTACLNQKPNTPRNTTVNHDHDQETGSSTTLQQMSSNDFDAVSNDQLSPRHDEIHDEYYSPSIITSEHINPTTPPERLPFTNSVASTATLYENDPDLMYMSSLLKIASVESFRDTARRQTPIRRTFSARPQSLADRAISAKQKEPSERLPPSTSQSTLTRSSSTTTASSIPSKKVNNDILKHALRIQSLSKEYLTKSSGPDTTRIGSSTSRTTATPMNNRQNSINKSSRSISVEPVGHTQSSTSRSIPLSIDDFPSIKTLPITRHLKTAKKHIISGTIPADENQNLTTSATEEQPMATSVEANEDLSLIQTSPLSLVSSSNLHDASYLDRSNSAFDAQSLTSSSLIQVPSSILSEQITHSTARRTNKKVSFYEEPTPVILTTTTTTYV